ncbi:MAG: hypothetical protein PHE15_06970 [Dehalococcoidales bacterium]|nr:hypothetical protein [Dehalococcoidales bacterium]
MKALSIKQPWAWLICRGFKDVENRPWKINAKGYSPKACTIDLPARVYVHTCKQMDFDGLMSIITGDFGDLSLKQRKWLNNNELIIEQMCGALIGEVDIVDCAKDSKSPWAAAGQYQFMLKNPVLYDKPIPYKGHLGFFEVKL